MLTEIYIEALDEELADQVWELWYAALISDELAAVAWWCVIVSTIRLLPFTGDG